MKYTNEPRHWCPYSEKYTGVDSLLSALLDGWTINKRVFRHETRISSHRVFTVYYFELKRGLQVVVMAVVNNPTIDKIIAQYRLHVITHIFFERVTAEASAPSTLKAETVHIALVS